jgi:hypothetical protein
VTAAGIPLLDSGIEKSGILLLQAMLSLGLEQSVMFDVNDNAANLKSSVAVTLQSI